MTQPVDKALIDALNAGYAARQQAPAPAPQAPAAGLPTLEDGSVPVVSSAGVVGSVPASQVADAQRAGYRVVSPEAHAFEVNKRAAGEGFRNQFLAASEGAFRGLTLGGSDWYARNYGREGFADEVALRKEANPYLAGAGEYGVQALAATLTGGASLGTGAGRLGAGLVGRGGASFLSRAGVKLVPALIEGAVDGAIQGAGAAVSESALTNKPLDAERLATAMGVGGLLGAGIGTAIGLPGLARGEARRLYDAGGALLSRTDDMASKLASARAAVGDAGGSALDRATAWADGVLSEHQDLIAKKAEEWRLRGASTGYKKADDMVERLKARQPEAYEKFNELLGEKLPTMARPETGMALGATRREMYDALQQVRKEVGGRFGSVIKELDSTGEKVAIKDLADELRTAAREEFRLVGQEAGRDELNWLANRLEEAHGKVKVGKNGKRTIVEDPRATFEELHKTRQTWDKNGAAWEKDTTAKGGQVEAYRKGREILESYFEKRADEAGLARGADFLDRYKQAKIDYAASQTAHDVLKLGLQGDRKNQSLGAKELWSAMAGSAALGPIGGIAAAGMAKLAKIQGDQAASAIASRLAKGESIRTVVDGVQRAVRTEIAKVAEKFPGLSRVRLALGEAAAPALESAKGLSLQQSLDSARGAWSSATKAASDIAAPAARAVRATGQAAIAGGEREAARWALLRDKVQQAQEDPTALDASRRISGSTHPDLQQALDAQSARTVGVLAKVLPPSPQPTFDIRGPQPRPAPPRAAQVAAARTIAVLDDPTEVVRRVQSGDLRPGDVQALSEAYPEQFARMQQDIVDEFYGRDLDPATRRRLGMVLGGPTDQTMTAPYLAAMAANSAEWGAEVEQNKPSRRSAPVRGASETAMTPAQKLGMGRG